VRTGRSPICRTRKDVYEIADDAVGTLQLHDYTFQDVHRRAHEGDDVAGGRRQRDARAGRLLFECSARSPARRSQNGETNPDFTTAAEVRRLGQQ